MIKYFNLKKQDGHIHNQIFKQIKKIINNDIYLNGEFTNKLEENYKKIYKSTYAVAVSSGTSALHLSLIALDVNKNDEVITVPMTFVATVAAIKYVNAKPVFVDIDKNNYLINIHEIEKKITKKTKVILPVNLYGNPVDIPQVRKLAKKYNLKILVDASQSHGAKINNTFSNTLGDITTFSFYPTKVLGAYGNGGIILTDNKKLYQKIKLLRNWGNENKKEYQLHAFNYRIDEIQASIVNLKVKKLHQYVKQRNIIANEYYKRLSKTNIVLPEKNSKKLNSFHIFPILVKNRKKIIDYLKKKKILVGVHYSKPVHLTTAYKNLKYKPGDFPVSELVAKQEISLPMYPGLKKSELNKICNHLIKANNKFNNQL